MRSNLICALHSGGLSRSYMLEVFYKIGDEMTHEHWFVKIPKTLKTVAMDERELTMYNTIFPRLQVSNDTCDQSMSACQNHNKANLNLFRNDVKRFF